MPSYLYTGWIMYSKAPLMISVHSSGSRLPAADVDPFTVAEEHGDDAAVGAIYLFHAVTLGHGLYIQQTILPDGENLSYFWLLICPVVSETLQYPKTT